MFHSPTFGDLTIDKVKERILSFMSHDPNSRYQLVIGTDSQPKNGAGIDFVTAIVIHRIGHGGIYFWKRIVEKKNYHLRSRIYHEATMSLATAHEFLSVNKRDGIAQFDIEIHVDIGNRGETRDMISEVVGMVRGSGFNVKTKPDSYGASKVADRHT